MTEELKLVEVTQADREAAAAAMQYRSWALAKEHSFRHDLLNEMAERFAYHRIASTPAIDREQVAREKLASEYRRVGDNLNADRIIHGQYVCEEVDLALAAIIALLSGEG